MPVAGPRKPIKVTVVPVNVTVARAPVVADAAAVPPLHAAPMFAGAQPEPNATADEVSSMRVPSGVGTTAGPTSNASTTTALSCALGFIRPVDSTATVWVPGARPDAVKIRDCGCSVGE